VAATWKGSASTKGKLQGAKDATKEDKAGVVFISSPGKHDDTPSDSGVQSDFVVEEIRPRDKNQGRDWKDCLKER
jgi:hypothetical protein